MPCPGPQQIIQLLAIGREGRQKTVTFGSDLPVAASVADPLRSLLRSDPGYERAAVGSECDSLFLGRAGGHLLRLPIRETLPPDVKTASGIGGEVHPPPI